MHFLCAYAHCRLDPQYLNYEIDFNTILFGIDGYKESVRVIYSNGELVDVRIYYYRNITINDSNSIRVEKKKKEAPFKDFSDYYNRLCSSVGGTILNAQDGKRKLQYGVVTTISKGYDAPCCAAIAKKYGCNTAVTFHAVGKYAEDSGVDIAKALGYKRILERDPDAYMARKDLVEAEQLSSGEIGSDLCFVAFDDIFSNNIVFTGDRGDSVWAKENSFVNDNFEFDDILSHIGFSERRLWLGYISIPMPLFGASAWSSIQRISNSDEMKPWIMNNDYDRPIPRRIVEEAGVSRNMFGIEKHGAGITFRYDWGTRLKRRLSKAAVNSFNQYLINNKKKHPIQTVQYFWKNRKIYMSRIGVNLGSDRSARDTSQIANATDIRYLIPWSSEVIQKRYKSILER